MDRKLVVTAQLAVALGHRIEVAESVDGLTGESAILWIIDLETGIRYRRIEQAQGEVIRWTGRVAGCTVTIGDHAAHTILDIEADADAVDGASALAALHGADAAADAAKAQADRWGGADRVPASEPDRFW